MVGATLSIPTSGWTIKEILMPFAHIVGYKERREMQRA